jgi:hypothetical protein
MSSKHLILALCLGLSLLGGATAGELPLLAVECEHASAMSGGQLWPDASAARSQCVQTAGDARLRLPVYVRRAGPYQVWVRAEVLAGKPAVSAAAEGQKAVSAAIGSKDWGWAKLGAAPLKRGRGLLEIAVSGGSVRLDQVVLAGDPKHQPKGTADSSESVRRALQDIYFADDFMRTQREPGPWELVSGTWKISELTVREQFDATRSANAFSFLGTGKADAPAVALTGYPFWRNYSLEAAARSIGGQPFGLVILHQDGENYVLLRFDPPNHRVELVRVAEGKETRLASRSGVLTVDQWYRVRLACCDGLLVASVDGHELFRATDAALLEGRAGLWSADPKGAYFDDVLVRSWESRFADFEDGSLAAWAADGKWKAAKGTASGTGVLLHPLMAEDFVAEAEVAPGAGDVGILFNWRDAKNCARLVLTADGKKAELRETTGGKTATIASAELLPSKAPRRVRLTQENGRVRTEIDGRPRVGAFRPKTAEGRLGLFADGKPASFAAVHLAKAQRPGPAITHNRIFAGEDTMEAWASAGSDWNLSSGDDRTVAWHELTHWGDCAVRYELSEPGGLPGKLGLVVRGDGETIDSGVMLVAEPKKDAPIAVSLVVGGKSVGSAAAPSKTPKAIALHWIAQSAAVFVDDQLVLSQRLPKPPAGRRMALWTEGWQPSLAKVSVDSEHVINDHFETAPVAWQAATGEWEMQNRWTCSPQWSWLGGGAADSATLWTKRQFGGDIAAHYFGAFQMKQVGGRIYRPHNLNVTICGDGRNPFSGYTFLCGGWNNQRTALLRNGKVVASTTKTALRPPTLLDTTPSTNYLHRKWWHLAIEKRGDVISCYMDEKLACQFKDPEPLDGGQACIWTFNNSIMVARTYISYERGGEMEAPLRPAPPSTTPKNPPPAITTSHKLKLAAFEEGLDDWGDAAKEAEVRLESGGDGHCLAVRNAQAGGAFHLSLPFAPFDAMEYPRLSFDYRLPGNVKINLQITVEKKTYSVALTSPDARPLGVTRLDDAKLTADDKWHTADIDLRGLLLRALPEAEALPVSAIAIAAPLEQYDYLRAGLDGNPAGAAYRLDTVRLWAPGPPEATFSWDKKLAAQCALDQKPDTDPGKKAESAGQFQTKDLADGTWYFHIKTKPEKGEWSTVAHVPIVVDNSPPSIAAAEPKAGSKTPAHVLRVRLADASGVNPKTLAAVKLNGKSCAVEVQPAIPTARSPERPARLDPATGELSVDLSLLPLSLKDGAKMELALPALADFLGRKAKEQTLAWTFDRGKDQQAPADLQLEASHPYLCRDDFEASVGQWKGYETSKGTVYSIIERDPTTAASGDCSLRIFNPYAGGPFLTYVRTEDFDAGQYPLVSFDYKVPANLRADLIVTVDDENYTIRFTDPNGSNCIGAFPDVQTDGQWHHTAINLHDFLVSAVPKATSYTITRLAFGDTGYDGNTDGVEYHIDNFTIAPAVSTREKPLEYVLTATDPSGIAAVQHSLVELPGSLKWQDAKEPKWSFQKLGAGLFQFAVRARDGAGNWSEPVTRRILIDDEPPAIQTVSPKDGGSAANGIIQIKVADAPAGLHRNKTRLTVAGKNYTVGQDGVTYDARKHTLTWTGTVLDEPVVFKNGQKVACELLAYDSVGNTAKKAWTWTMDYSLDKTPPAAPYVARVPSKPLVRDTFEKDDGQWKGYGKYGSVARSAAASATGRYSLRIRATRSNSYFGAYARRKSFNAATYPIVSFDYRMPPGMPMNLHVHDGNSWRTIRLTSNTSNYTVVGVVPLKADNQWHHADINLMKYFKATEKKGKPYFRVRYLLFSDFETRSIRAGTRFYVDNFTIAAPEKGKSLDFEWTDVADPTGIAGYAVALDTKADTEPKKLSGTETAASFDDLYGATWYLHLRARDGAGNWSPTIHVPTKVDGPPKPKPEPKKEKPEAKVAEKKAAVEKKAKAKQAAREKAAKEKAAKEKAAREEAAKAKAEKERLAKEKAAREKAAREKAEREKAEKAKAEAAKKAAEEKARQEQAKKEQAAKEKAAREKAAREKAAKEKAKAEAAKKAAEEKANKEQAAQEQGKKEQAKEKRKEQEKEAEKAKEVKPKPEPKDEKQAKAEPKKDEAKKPAPKKAEKPKAEEQPKKPAEKK